MLVDALGWTFVERFAERASLLARLRSDGVVSKLTTQFPSTTTAHVTTLHTAQPVGEHGAYEWFIYEPSLDRLVCPLMAAFAGESQGGLVAAGADLRAVYPQADGLAARLSRLGVTCNSVQPAATVDTPYTQLVCAGATAHGVESARAGAALAARLAQAEAPSLTLLYLDDFDSSGHELGPDDPRSEAIALDLLDALERELVEPLAGTPGALVLLFADHGQLPTDPERCVYVNERCPQLVPLLRRGADGRPLAPAGSARDLFLHVREGALDEAVGLLGGALRRGRLGRADGRARGRRRLRAARLGALPRAGRRPRRAAAGGRGGVVARARAASSRTCAATTAGWSRRRPRPGSERSSRDGAAPARGHRPAALPGLGRRGRRERPHARAAPPTSSRCCAAACRRGSSTRTGRRSSAASAFPP